MCVCAPGYEEPHATTGVSKTFCDDLIILHYTIIIMSLHFLVRHLYSKALDEHQKTHKAWNEHQIFSAG